MPRRVVFVYPNRRERLLEEIARGVAPDTSLLGQNHLAELGVDAGIHEATLTRDWARTRLPPRLLWNLREVLLPWELGSADVVCTSLATLFPLTARARGRPRVVLFNMGLCNVYERSSRARRALIRPTLRAAAAVVCFASAQRERLLEQTGLGPDRVHLALLGVDARFHVPTELPADGYVLGAGRDMARDYATFAAALDGLDARAVLVASRRNLEGVRLPPNVETRIDVSHADLRDLYAGAACVVVPTRREGFPYGADCSGQTVLLDAMASARPVVLSERATLTDYVVPGETAVTVPAEDPGALREAIQRVLSDRALAGQLGDASRRLVEERLTTPHLAARLAPIVENAG
jgi:glycosyltransferase involved in cell wall biosynthesis